MPYDHSNLLQTIQLRLEQEGYRKIVPKETYSESVVENAPLLFEAYNPRGEQITIQVEKRDLHNYAIYSHDGENYSVFQGGFHL